MRGLVSLPHVTRTHATCHTGPPQAERRPRIAHWRLCSCKCVRSSALRAAQYTRNYLRRRRPGDYPDTCIRVWYIVQLCSYAQHDRYAPSTSQAVVDLGSLSSILSVTPDVADAPNAHHLRLADPSKGASVAFRHVSFSYPSNAAAGLRDISFDLAAGDTLALVGSTGSGEQLEPVESSNPIVMPGSHIMSNSFQ